MTHLVIGYGLLGRAIVRALRDLDIPVRVLDMHPVENSGTHNLTGDIRQRDVVQAACEGVETVYHTAALISQELGKPRAIYDVNVTGTEHVIAACRKQGVRQLVYTSSIDVVFDGTPIQNGDESLPYPARYLDYYSETKMLAEQRVLAANDADLRTVSLRVAGLYGPHDHQRFPPVIAITQNQGFVRVGDGSAKFNHLYVDNAAHAHLLAADTLRQRESQVAGSAYFITDYPATNFFDFIERYLQALGLLDEGSVRRIPYAVAWMLASGLEFRYRLMPVAVFSHPVLSRYVVASTCRDFWFSHQKATDDFGYAPVVAAEDARHRTLDWLRKLDESITLGH